MKIGPNPFPEKFTDAEWASLTRWQRWYWKNRDALIAKKLVYNKEWRAKNIEYVLKRDRDYSEANRDERRLKDLKYREKNGDLIRERQRRYRRERGEEMRAKDNERYRRDREKRIALVIHGDLKKKEAIAGRPKPDNCELCSRPGKGKSMHFDHCHATGKFRGWICRACNVVLGQVNDDPAWLRKLADYAEHHAKENAA